MEEMQGTVKERILQFIEFKGISKNKFHTDCDLSSSYLQNLKKDPKPPVLQSILRTYPELNSDWLLYGSGPMLKSDIVDDEPRGNFVYLIPDETTASAGYFSGLSEGVNKFDCSRIQSPFVGAEIAIQVSGDSMTPGIKSGDRLFLRRIDDRAFIPWGHTVVLDTTNGAIVKEIQPCDEDPDYIMALSTNPKYPPYKIEASSIRAIFKILGILTINTTL